MAEPVNEAPPPGWRWVPAIVLFTLAVLGACILATVALARITEWVWWLVS